MIAASTIVAALDTLPARDTATVRKLRRQFSRQLASESGRDVLRLVLELLRHEVPRFFAYELCAGHPTAMALVDERTMLRMAGRLDSWWVVDCFGVYVAGPTWRAKRVRDSVILQWTRSQNQWWRRAALVSTVALNAKSRGGTGDTRRTLRVCTLLRADRDPMVVKALSWALRELSKRDPVAVRGFLGAHSDVLPKIVVREVRAKLETGVLRSTVQSA